MHRSTGLSWDGAQALKQVHVTPVLPFQCCLAALRTLDFWGGSDTALSSVSSDSPSLFWFITPLSSSFSSNKGWCSSRSSFRHHQLGTSLAKEDSKGLQSDLHSWYGTLHPTAGEPAGAGSSAARVASGVGGPGMETTSRERGQKCKFQSLWI